LDDVSWFSAEALLPLELLRQVVAI
jgi:hypothetical protein